MDLCGACGIHNHAEYDVIFCGDGALMPDNDNGATDDYEDADDISDDDSSEHERDGPECRRGKRHKKELHECAGQCFGKTSKADFDSFRSTITSLTRHDRESLIVYNVRDAIRWNGEENTYARFDFEVQFSSGAAKTKCCKQCFQFIMDVPTRTMTRIIAHVKKSLFGGTDDQNALNAVGGVGARGAGKRLLRDAPKTLREATLRARKNGLLNYLTMEDLQTQCHKGTALFSTWAQFMKRTREKGQKQPASRKTLLKNFNSKKEVYEMYVDGVLGIDRKKPETTYCFNKVASTYDDVMGEYNVRPSCTLSCCPFSHDINVMTPQDMEQWLQKAKPPTHRQYLKPSTFYSYWNDVFPDIVVHDARAVQGKCSACTVLERLASTTARNPDSREANVVKAANDWHRVYTENERDEYHKMREEARVPGADILTIIVDGAATSKSHVPHEGQHAGVLDSSCTVKMEGTITHGHERAVVRVWPHIKHGANVSIHAVSCAIDAHLKAVENNRDHGDGTMVWPSRLHLQIDGGPENACNAFYAFAETVLLTLFEVVVLFRLPPGHTHEDIDAMFGELWSTSCTKFIMTPEEQKREYARVLAQGKQGNGKARFVDAFVIPDYERWLCGKSKTK